LTLSSNDEALRPYDGVDAFDDTLDDLAIQVKNQRVWVDDGDLELSREDFNPLSLVFRWPLELQASRETLEHKLEKADLKASEVSLVGLVRSSISKQIRRFYDKSLADLLECEGESDYEIDMSCRPRALPTHSVDVEFFLLLNQTKERRGLYPFMKGTWLCSKTFTVKTNIGTRFNFEWLPLDAEQRQELGAAVGSSIFITNLLSMREAEDFGDCVDAYMDVDIKRFLGEEGKSAISILTQTMFTGEVLSSACEKAFREIRESSSETSWADVSETPVLGQFIETIAADGKHSGGEVTAEQVFNEFLERPEKIRDAVDDLLKVKSLILAAGASTSINGHDE